MVEVNEKNRNVHLLPKTGNGKANKHTMEIWFLPRCALKSNGNHVVVLESTGDETIVPEERPKECRKLMVTSPQLVELPGNQKINGFLPVRQRGQLLFMNIFSLCEDGDEISVDHSWCDPKFLGDEITGQ